VISNFPTSCSYIAQPDVILFHWVLIHFWGGAKCALYSLQTCEKQGCVRGQHGRGQGQGHKILSSRSRPVLGDPIPGEKAWIIVVSVPSIFGPGH